MALLRELTSAQSEAWMQALRACAPHDFYHLPQYHAMAERAGEGSASLFVYEEGSHTIVLPLLLRNIEMDNGDWNDATSVYGYPGPLASSAPLPEEVIRNFQAALLDRLREKRIVTVFSRLHPFFPQRPLLEGLGSCVISETVSVDLTLPLEVQRAKYRDSFKRAVNRLRKSGYTVIRDTQGAYFEDFVRIYTETMHRVEAADRYFFPPSYFKNLQEALGPQMSLFVVQLDGVPVCGGLFVACQGILQYHLGGTLDSALAVAPMKLLIDEVRLWANTQDLHSLHLGGGITPHPDDALLYFKRGFSDRRHEFAAWRWTVLPEANDALNAEHERKLAEQNLRPASTDFFPAYRSPAVAREFVLSGQ